MVGTKIHKAIALVICMYVAYLIFYRQAFAYRTSQSTADEISSVDDINIIDSCMIPAITDYDQFYRYFDKPKAVCNHTELVGGHSNKDNIMDGHKLVCFDSGFKANECVIYSFGISNEWSFDDYMDQKRQCQVFAFDPTMKAKDHKRSNRISFFNLGISNFKGFTRIKDQKCSMDRYRGIVENNGHTSTVIDYLKMDIERSEIPVFLDILENDLKLLSNIQQIGLEIHPGYPGKPKKGEAVGQHFQDFWVIFHRLECLGWRLLHVEMNQVPGNHFSFRGSTRSCCYEVVLIKT